MGSERRRHPRVMTSDLPLRLVDGRGQEEGFDLVDLSEAGARIRCHHAIQAMTRIRVAMVIPGSTVGRGEDARLATEGVVVWCHPVEEGVYDTGVFFPDLEEPDRRLLVDFVRQRA